MISGDQISFVVQGDVRKETIAALKSVRRVMPQSRLIFSTFSSPETENLAPLCDLLVISEDPGPHPPYLLSRHSRPNNINRQIVSTSAGLSVVDTPYVVKMRSDSELIDDGFLTVYECHRGGDAGSDRMVVSSFFTRHPEGLSCYLFHVSDWFFFGMTTIVKRFWDVPKMTLDDATWFERHRHISSSTRNAMRFRARYTPEQYLTTQFARNDNYDVPSYLNERSDALVASYKSLLANRFVVCPPRMIGIRVEKYEWAWHSLYLRIDCVGYFDWSLWSLGRESSGRVEASTVERVVVVLRTALHRHRGKVIAFVMIYQASCNFFVRVSNRLRFRR